MRTPLLSAATGTLVAWIVVMTSVGAAQDGLHVPIQGYLTDKRGVPLDGEHTLEFVLYAQRKGGVALYAETHPQVGVEGGSFSVLLGEGTPRPSNEHPWDRALFSVHGARFLEVIIGPMEAIEPRIPLGEIPYAVKASQAGDVVPDSPLAQRLAAIEEGLAAIEARLSARHYFGELDDFERQERCVANSVRTIHDCFCDPGAIPVGGGAFKEGGGALQDSKPSHDKVNQRWAWRVGCINFDGTRVLCDHVSYWCVPFEPTGPITPDNRLMFPPLEIPDLMITPITPGN